MKKLLGILVLG